MPEENLEQSRNKIRQEMQTAKSIYEMWTLYRLHVMSSSSPEIQVRETKRAFYAGCEAIFTLMLHQLEYTGDTEPTEVDLNLMDTWHQEVQAFAAAVKRGDQ